METHIRRLSISDRVNDTQMNKCPKGITDGMYVVCDAMPFFFITSHTLVMVIALMLYHFIYFYSVIVGVVVRVLYFFAAAPALVLSPSPWFISCVQSAVGSCIRREWDKSLVITQMTLLKAWDYIIPLFFVHCAVRSRKKKHHKRTASSTARKIQPLNVI